MDLTVTSGDTLLHAPTFAPILLELSYLQASASAAQPVVSAAGAARENVLAATRRKLALGNVKDNLPAVSVHSRLIYLRRSLFFATKQEEVDGHVIVVCM